MGCQGQWHEVGKEKVKNEDLNVSGDFDISAC